MRRSRVAAEARGGIAPKAAHLGVAHSEAEPKEEVEGRDWREARLPVPNALGLHARPAARFVQAVADFDAQVEVANATTGGGPSRPGA